MKYPLLQNFPLVIGLLLTASACSSSGNREFKEALNQEQAISRVFAEHIRPGLPENGTIIVLVSPQIGPRLQEAQTYRLQGFRQALGESRVHVVPITSAEDERLLMVENDYVPPDLFLEALKAHPPARVYRGPGRAPDPGERGFEAVFG